jgi:hypothetical protein
MSKGIVVSVGGEVSWGKANEWGTAPIYSLTDSNSQKTQRLSNKDTNRALLDKLAVTHLFQNIQDSNAYCRVDRIPSSDPKLR